MPGLDPRIHDELPDLYDLHMANIANRIMGCRIKPGNDGIAQ